jgi:hypothetical protein
MDRETYLSLIRDLLSGDPWRVRGANRLLYGALVGGDPLRADAMRREADLVLAELPQA